MSKLADKLRLEFQDREYRHAYVDSFLNSSIATQIKVLREQREWSQEQLAREANMKQPRISALENVNYSSWSINTLKRLAEAFDVTLKVSFESFGTRLVDIDRFSRESLERFSFDEDPAFAEEQVGTASAASALVEALKDYQPSQKAEDPKKAKDNLVYLDDYRKARQQALLTALQQLAPKKPSEEEAPTSALVAFNL